MCVSAVVFRQGQERWCQTIGDVADALDVDVSRIPMQDDPGTSPSRPNRDACLCNVDVPALATMLAMSCDPPEYGDDADYFDAWVLRDPRHG